MAKKPLYIQLEPGAYPKDSDWQIMSASDRGCYHSLIVFLSCNKGKLSYNPKKLANLCNVNENVFEIFWKSFSHKFIKKNGKIQHSRVNKELVAARKYIKQKSLAGKKGMQQRYNNVITPLQKNPNGDITKERKGKERKGKVRKEDTTGTRDSDFKSSDGLRFGSDEVKFYDNACKVFGVISKSDRTTFRNISKHLNAKASSGDTEVFKQAWKIAQDSMSGDKPIALFVSKMKLELDYLRGT